MVVGVMKVSLLIEGSGSLKSKRKVVRSILDRLRAKFNLAAAEVEDNDLWQRAGLGLAFVSNDRSFVNSMMDTVLDFMERNADAEIIDTNMEIINLP